jgi:hypothetical protein
MAGAEDEHAAVIEPAGISPDGAGTCGQITPPTTQLMLWQRGGGAQLTIFEERLFDMVFLSDCRARTR